MTTRALLAAGLAALWAAGCGGAADPPAPPEPSRRGVVLISIDTLRADRLGAYGYARPTSPFLDRLAARGVVFENAIVQLPGTLPSHMSIFTGLYPAEHGVYPPDGVLSARIETLPEAFRRHGYRTAGFTEGVYVAGGYGFSRGFDRFSDEAAGTPRDVERTFARGLDFLRGLAPGEPFFLFLHTYAVHDPYDPPEPWRSALAPGPPPPGTFAPTGANLTAVNRGEASVTREQVAHFSALYDAGVRYVDSVLAAWLAEVEALGLLDETLVVVTSDHGEELFEHGMMVHEQVYHETLHVPLVFVHPALPARRVARLVESVDLAPTLHAWAGLEPGRPFSGRSLLPLLAGAGEPEGEAAAYAESFDGSDRSLYLETAGDLFHAVHSAPPAEEGGTWVGESIGFDHHQPTLAFDAMSFDRPRRVRVEVDGRPVTDLALDPAWRPFALPLPAGGGRRRVRLTADGCVSPREVGLNADPRCLAFRVAGLALGRSELFRPLADPAERHDLADELPEVAALLARRLRRYRFTPVAEAGRTELTDEQVERLRALGYLR